MIPGSLLNGYITANNQYFEKVLPGIKMMPGEIVGISSNNPS
jgi:hypothetical protein